MWISYVILQLMLGICPTISITTTEEICNFSVEISTLRCFNLMPGNFRNIRNYGLSEIIECVTCNVGHISAGVFDDFSRATFLSLENCNVTGLESYSFVGLIYLKELILEDNKLKVLLPGVFKGIKNVIKLNLRGNQLRQLEKNTFSELENLEDLDLSNNRITDIYPGAFNNLKHLKVFTLEGNQISTLGESFRGLSSIVQLNLRSNLLRRLSPNELSTASLIELDLSKNHLCSISPNSYILLRNLNYLYLNNNNLSKLEMGTFNGLRRVEHIDLTHNFIEAIPTKLFLKLNRLKTLILSNNNLKTIQFAAYTSLPDLTHLNLSRNSIKAIVPGNILKLYKLQTLDVSYNNLSDLDYKQLFEHAPSLIVLYINNNNIPCYTIKELLQYFNQDNVIIKVNDNRKYYGSLCNFTEGLNLTRQLREIEKIVISEPIRTINHIPIIYTVIFVISTLTCIIGYFQRRIYLNLNISRVN